VAESKLKVSIIDGGYLEMGRLKWQNLGLRTGLGQVYNHGMGAPKGV
jgi:hypothetical protein